MQNATLTFFFFFYSNDSLPADGIASEMLSKYFDSWDAVTPTGKLRFEYSLIIDQVKFRVDFKCDYCCKIPLHVALPPAKMSHQHRNPHDKLWREHNYPKNPRSEELNYTSSSSNTARGSDPWADAMNKKRRLGSSVEGSRRSLRIWCLTWFFFLQTLEFLWRARGHACGIEINADRNMCASLFNFNHCTPTRRSQ